MIPSTTTTMHTRSYPLLLDMIAQEGWYLARIPIDLLTIDARYQRPLSDRSVARIVERYYLPADQPLTVSERADGTLAVIDGQSRREVHMILKTEPLCHVWVGLTSKEEARVFELCNDTPKPNVFDLLRTRLYQQDPDALAMVDVVESVGCHFAFPGTPIKRAIFGVNACEHIYRIGGKEHLRDVLDIAVSAWPGEDRALRARVLAGISLFHRSYQKTSGYRPSNLIKSLEKIAVTTMMQRANQFAEMPGSQGRAYSVAHALLSFYNKYRTVGQLDVDRIKHSYAGMHREDEDEDEEEFDA